MIAKPDVPGTVLRFRGSTAPRIAPSASETVAVPIVTDWGPVGADAPGTDGTQGGKQLVTSFDDFVNRFGDSDTAGRTAVAGAFAGENLPGATGAGGVLVYRQANGAVASSVTLVDVAAPANNALQLVGKYKGTRGDRISVTIDADPSDDTRDRLRVFFDGSLRETYLYAQTDVAGLAAAVNLRSALVAATNLEGAPARLATVADESLVGGADGDTLAAQDHLDALSALEFAPFGIISPYNLTDGAILASYVSWVQSQEDANRPVRLVVGGAAGETVDTAVSRSASCADPHVINVGVGTFHDDLLDKDLSTAELAPRVAGILAAKGQTKSLTFSRLGGLHAVGVTGIASDQVGYAIQSGVVVLMQVEASDADLAIAKGVTTFTDEADPDRPLDVFSDARLVGILDNYIRDMRTWGDQTIIGNGEVNDDSRAAVYGKARALQNDLLGQGLILPADDTVSPPVVAPWVTVTNTDSDPVYSDSIPYQFGWRFARTANNILGEGTVT